MRYVKTFISDDGIVVGSTLIPGYAVQFAVLLLAAFGIHQIAVRLILPLLEAFAKKTKTRVDDIIFRYSLLKRAFHLIPATVVSAFLPVIWEDTGSDAYLLISKALGLYYVLIGVAVYDALLNSVRDIYDKHGKSRKVGLTGAFQALKVVGVLVAVILAVSLLAGKSPVYFLSGLGAFTAILMLIFKDPILGLVAGVQLAGMDLVRKGDWIEIPKHGADGNVVDINLTTVQVQNWDRTITAVPAYELVSSSFKNWRGMFEGGGRRIKRSLRFRTSSIHFLSDEEIDRLGKIKILREYFGRKIADIEEFNAKQYAGCDTSAPGNCRRLTNIGTYRAYCEAYLRSHQGINQNLILMVRLLQQTEMGVPLELYAFTSDVSWIGHENVQSDIFDHLMAIAPEFGLVIFQRS
jgi:miniconductance mechanosensitive channel